MILSGWASKKANSPPLNNFSSGFPSTLGSMHPLDGFGGMGERDRFGPKSTREHPSGLGSRSCRGKIWKGSAERFDLPVRWEYSLDKGLDRCVAQTDAFRECSLT